VFTRSESTLEACDTPTHDERVNDGQIVDLKTRLPFALKEFEGLNCACRFVRCTVPARTEKRLAVGDGVILKCFLFFHHQPVSFRAVRTGMKRRSG